MSPSFRQRKLKTALWIMLIGMVAALGWAGYQGWGLGRAYPYNTFLYRTDLRFGDLTDLELIALQPNPYFDPLVFYLPFLWLSARWATLVPLQLQLCFGFCFAFGALLFFLDDALGPVIKKASRRTWTALLLMLTCYPVIANFDRANVELFLVVLVSGAIFSMARSNYILAAVCMVLAISVKFPQAILLVLLVRRCRPGLIVAALGASVILTLISLVLLGCDFGTTWNYYQRNMECYMRLDILQNYTLEASASPWNAFKLILLALGSCGLIAPVDFNYDASFIRSAYAVYAVILALLALSVATYSSFLERKFSRAAIALLLLLSVSAPSGGDYRLLYASVALAMLIVEPEKRKFDFTAVILLALVMVPKREFLLPFAGKTESDWPDVSIQVALNPLFILAALFLLLAGSRASLNLRWSGLRVIRFVRAMLPLKTR